MESALAVVSGEYLIDSFNPEMWSGNFSLRSGEITRLSIRRLIVGPMLRKDVQSIEIVSARYILEASTYTEDE